MTSTSTNITDFKALPGIVGETGFWYYFPTVTSTSRTNKEIFWRILVGLEDTEKDKLVKLTDNLFENKRLDEKYIAVIRVESGYVGGKIKDAPDTYVREGKNIGKSNETNVFCQALREAYSKYTKQADKTTAQSTYIRPMLATNIKDIKKITWPMYVQCKFDGNRAMTRIDTDRTVMFYSRNLKPIKGVPQTVEGDILKLYSAAGQYFVNKSLPKASREVIFFDGELYKHMASLQSLGALRKKTNADNTDPDLKYYIYDLYFGKDPKMSFADRLDMLRGISEKYTAANGKNTSIVFVDTYLAATLEQAENYYKEFLNNNYEGAMLRIPDAAYEQSPNNYHSKVLIKMKPRHDNEFEVIGIAGGESKGKEEGALMIICTTDDGESFTVQPALPLSQRIALFDKYSKNRQAFKTELSGKYIKVYYDDVSDDGIPLRAKTKLEVRKDL